MTDMTDVLKAIESMKKDMATKEDLKGLATKTDLETLELKVEAVNSNVGKAREEIIKTKAEIIEHVEHTAEIIFKEVGEQHRKLEKRVENIEKELLHKN